jgi:DNA repair exonuclease SbcCD ATPase subunit
MIIFERIRFCNFLATGNEWTELSLLPSAPTLIVGKNGTGKSTFIDALFLALFNRPFRSIRKDQIVNSITEKGLIVECRFTKGNNHYLVRRGIKPNLFQVIQNDEPWPQTYATNSAGSRKCWVSTMRHSLRLPCSVLVVGNRSCS